MTKTQRGTSEDFCIALVFNTFDPAPAEKTVADSVISRHNRPRRIYTTRIIYFERWTTDSMYTRADIDISTSGSFHLFSPRNYAREQSNIAVKKHTPLPQQHADIYTEIQPNVVLVRQRNNYNPWVFELVSGHTTGR